MFNNEIIKRVKITLTKEEIESPNPIKIKLTVEDCEGESATYTITYPKDGE